MAQQRRPMEQSTSRSENRQEEKRLFKKLFQLNVVGPDLVCLSWITFMESRLSDNLSNEQ